MLSVAAVTGLTGFLGRHLLPSLLAEYKYVINYSRGGRYTLYTANGAAPHSGDSSTVHKNYPPNVFYNLATYYNSTPKNLSEMMAITEANIIFPLNILNVIDNPNLRIVNLCSYLQLQNKKLDNPYELSKEYFKITIQSTSQDVSNIFLFDTFGKNDTRNKVVDVFIQRILSGNPIVIPNNKILINLSDATDVCASLAPLQRIPLADSCIRSPFTTSLFDLAKKLMELLHKKVEIISNGEKCCHYSNCEKLPVNIFKSANNEDISEQLLRRAHDIRSS